MNNYVPGLYDLRLGDADASSRWGGQARPLSGSFVRDMQIALIGVGAMTGIPDGTFGEPTRVAVRRFQWHLQNVRIRLTSAGQAVPHQGVYPAATGVLSSATRLALADFTAGGFACAGPLVRVSFASLNRFRKGPGYQQLIALEPSIVVDREFSKMLVAMNGKAQEQGIFVHANQAFRVEGAPVSGAVVQPAGFSAHKLGRAIDLQLGDATAPPLSSAILAAPVGAPFGKFREHMKSLGCRYGGNFVQVDTPHFDQQVFPAGSEVWRNHFYFAQRQFLVGPGSTFSRIPAA